MGDRLRQEPVAGAAPRPSGPQAATRHHRLGPLSASARIGHNQGPPSRRAGRCLRALALAQGAREAWTNPPLSILNSASPAPKRPSSPIASIWPSCSTPPPPASRRRAKPGARLGLGRVVVPPLVSPCMTEPSIRRAIASAPADTRGLRPGRGVLIPSRHGTGRSSSPSRPPPATITRSITTASSAAATAMPICWRTAIRC